MSNNKVCIRCGTEKPATPEFFYRDNRRSDGLHVYCKVCKSDTESNGMVKK